MPYLCLAHSRYRHPYNNPHVNTISLASSSRIAVMGIVKVRAKDKVRRINAKTNIALVSN